MNASADITAAWPIALAAALSFVLTGVATWYARYSGLLDYPGERHSHAEVTPRGGGAGLVLSVLLASLLVVEPELPVSWSYCILPGAIVLAALGWWDDHHPLGVATRLAVQLAVSVYVVAYGIDGPWGLGAVTMFLACMFVVWMINLYNFMDGSNGMAGLQGVFAASLLSWLFHRAGDVPDARLALLLGAACAGFLPWNLGRARVFMGDVGSLFLGFVLAVLLLRGVATTAFSVPVAMMVMAVFLTDSTLTLVRRVLRGERWYNPHKQHLYQRLIAHGWSHGRVALMYQVINLGLIVPGVILAVSNPALDWTVASVMALVLGGGWFVLIKSFGVLAEAG